jgi:protein-S-isoprenylcysteine O-methyltransferase Ste14
MNPWFGKAILLAGLIASIAIRWPHEGRRATVKVAESRRDTREVVLLALVSIGFLVLPIVYVATPVLAFADYGLRPASLAAGTVVMAAALWLFHRSHVDLGTNWSPTLELRENHSLVTHGVYQKIRHPMYTALFAYGVAQTLLLPNWIAGPSCLVMFTIMFALRLRAEEGMMREKFGAEYDSYMSRTKRLVPGVW